MKIFVEQIILNEGLLVYSNFVKFTNSEDEEGSDYEYDFNSVYSNLDGIQNTIVRLYGTQGLIKIFNYYAQGDQSQFAFESIEFEEGSELKEIIEKISNNQSVAPINYDNNIIPSEVVKQNPDQLFLLTGLIAGLPLNDDLNVMKMMARKELLLSSEMKERALKAIIQSGYSNDADFKMETFEINGLQRIAAVGDSVILIFVLKDNELYIDFPVNEIQINMNRLFGKYITFRDVSFLKKSLIIESEFNSVAKASTNESLPNYLLLFDVESAKFESKEKNLTL